MPLFIFCSYKKPNTITLYANRSCLATHYFITYNNTLVYYTTSFSEAADFFYKLTRAPYLR